MSRILYTTFVEVGSLNGILQRQEQVLGLIAREHPGQVDVLNLRSSPADTRAWAGRAGIDVRVQDGPFERLARWNADAWYYGQVVLRNRLRVGRHFGFPLRTPAPASLLARYDSVISYYAWPWFLLGLDRIGARAIVDLGDIMASRHERIGYRRWISLAPEDERRLVHSDARCVAISSSDRLGFQQLYGKQMPVAPFVPPRSGELLSLAGAPGPRRVGFLGGRGHGSEEAVALIGSEEFLATLSAAGVQLVVAGSICGDLPQPVSDRLLLSGAQIAGPVDRLPAFYGGVRVVLNPVGPSTGVKVKSVEALLAGRMLVTTEFGVDDALREAFGSQIREVGWPVSAAVLARTVEEAIDAAGGEGRREAAEQYVARSERTATEIFAP